MSKSNGQTNAVKFSKWVNEWVLYAMVSGYNDLSWKVNVAAAVAAAVTATAVAITIITRTKTTVTPTTEA